MFSNPESSYVPHDTFAQSHLQILWQDKWCTCIKGYKDGLQPEILADDGNVHQKLVSQAKQTSCDKPHTFLNKSKDLDHVLLSKLPDA